MTETNLKSYVAKVKQEIDALLSDFLNQKIVDASRIGSEYQKLLNVIAKQTLRGGKRLRPSLAMLGYEIAGGKDRDKMLKAAMSLEIFHNYLLMHDDIMDHDDKRHGGLNVTGVYKRRYSRTLNSLDVQHVANSIAMLAGDICCGLSYESLIASGMNPQQLVSAISRLNTATFEVAAGQHLDLIGSVGKSLTISDIKKINQYKTADYTVIMPLQFGAILAGGPATLHTLFAKFGNNAGVAFQLSDDDLGVFGSPKLTGKPVGSDIKEGKQTVLMHNGIELTKGTQRDFIKRCINNPKLTAKDVKKVQNILIKSGARQKTVLLAQDLANAAIDITNEIPNSSNRTHLLAEFAQYCVARSS